MSEIIVFTDPHEGLKRTANTTPASSERLREAIHAQLKSVVEMNADFRICAGDWFDTYSNDENTIAKTFPVISKVDVVIAGNHDLINIKGKLGSLGLIREMLPNQDSIPINDVGESGAFHYEHGMHSFYVVPHCSTQELFEKALDKAKNFASKESRTGKKFYLFLHCNYNSNFASGRQTDLNLSKIKAAELIDTFDYIILGHEHIPREDFQGRLIVLGNTHPTSFSDVSDKRVMRITDDGIKFIPVWYKSQNYIEVDWQSLEDSYPHQFIRIVGNAKPEDIREISQAAKLIERNSLNLFALKVDVEFEGIGKPDMEKTEKTQTMMERVSQALEASDKELFELWQEFTA